MCRLVVVWWWRGGVLPKAIVGKLDLACAVALGSISMACIWKVLPACSQRCASISAISPLPVPMSNIRTDGMSGNGAHAPIRTPSVPTRIAQWSCHTVNR